MLSMNLVVWFICSSHLLGAATRGPLGPRVRVLLGQSHIADSAEQCADDKEPDCLTNDDHPKHVCVAVQLAGQ
jgi:hypothetical protein